MTRRSSSCQCLGLGLHQSIYGALLAMSDDDIAAMSVKQLRAHIKAAGLSDADCVEKADLRCGRKSYISSPPVDCRCRSAELPTNWDSDTETASDDCSSRAREASDRLAAAAQPAPASADVASGMEMEHIGKQLAGLDCVLAGPAVGAREPAVSNVPAMCYQREQLSCDSNGCGLAPQEHQWIWS